MLSSGDVVALDLGVPEGHEAGFAHPAVIVTAQLLLLPTVWPLAFLPGSDLGVRLAALGSLIAMVPGVIATRRAAAALVLVTGRRRTQRTCRRFHAGLVLAGVIAAALPML